MLIVLTSTVPQEPKTDFDNDTVEELEAKIPAMEEQLKQLSNVRNYVQLERDTVNSFRGMSRGEVERLQGLLKMRDIELAEHMENHRVELEVYAHKVKLSIRKNNDTLFSLTT